MQEKKSLKHFVWQKSDIVKVCAVYLSNFIILGLLFVAMAYFNGVTGGMELKDYFVSSSRFLNFVILLFFLVCVMVVYFFFEDRNFLHNAVNSEMLFFILEVCLIVSFASGKLIDIYIRPLALVAVLTLFLANSRTAVFMSFIYCLMTFLYDAFTGVFQSDSSGYSSVFFLAMGISSSVIAIYFLNGVYSRLSVLIRSLLLSIPAMVCIILPIEFGSTNIWLTIAFGAASGPFAAILFMTLLPIFEGMFHRASFFKYAELTGHKSPLIRKLISQAPGTFNHSIVVSNIAEACAAAIEEDALLARTCAYYHDIGKLRRPEFFMENQAGGANPHDDLTPELSANIIKAHAQDGEQLLRKHRFPAEIASVCSQHHGTLPIVYFYDKAKKFTDGDVNYSQYCYPGPKPQSKIAAIIMIADGCEAASRALKDRSREKVFAMVKKIVSDRMELGQFDECEITLKELNLIINTVVNSLTGVYHVRAEYPKISLLSEKEKSENASKEAKEDK